MSQKTWLSERGSTMLIESECLRLSVVNPPTKELPRLVLRRPAIARGVNELFEAMLADRALRDDFVANPARVLSKFIGGSPLPPQRASIANQLLYTLLSNPPLLDWLRDYETEHREVPPHSAQFMSDFTRAVMRLCGDCDVVSFLKSAGYREGDGDNREGPYGFISHSAFIFSGAAISTDQQQQQQQQQTQVQNLIGPLASDLRSSQNFEINTEAAPPATVEGDRTPTVIVAQDARVAIDALVRLAAELQRSGALEWAGAAGVNPGSE
jgi:hypothetical protein